jgi:glycosyltransferase involved in cell wall biosynthesis
MSGDTSPRYVIVTPVRDEAKHIEKAIKSVISQTILPAEWIIVDDGSSDATPEILERHASRYPWMTVIKRRDRGFRKPGGGVMEAFYAGYRELKTAEWSFIVKLDGDLSFESDYFERCFDLFSKDPRLGIGGGEVYCERDGALTLEGKHPLFHVRGATKIYRRECWEDIGGLFSVTGWDTLDEVKGNMLKWNTRTFSELRVIHHRHAGAADGTWVNLVKNGRANYISGYHPLFMAVKCLKRLFEKPYLVGSIALMHGFLSGYYMRVQRVDDAPLIEYLRRQQVERLVGKDSIWR